MVNDFMFERLYILTTFIIVYLLFMVIQQLYVIKIGLCAQDFIAILDAIFNKNWRTSIII